MATEASMFFASNVVTSHSKSTGHDLSVQELRLPKDFKWGVTTAAVQIEGGVSQDGKGKSIWDTFTYLEPSRTNNENADIACDHYNLWEEDVDLIASLAAEVYRFSVAWSRIIPLGGRDDPEFRADFENYARVCFSRFGDRVKKWVTFNEPYIISIFGHHSGGLAPGHNKEYGFDTKTEPWRVGHTIILSHASVVQLFHDEFQPKHGGAISIVFNGHFYEPYDAKNQADIDAAQRRLEFHIGWWGDPIFLGQDYPARMRKQLGSRLPEFTAEERELL